MCVSQTVKIIFEAWFYNLVGNSAKDKIDKMKKKKKKSSLNALKSPMLGVFS